MSYLSIAAAALDHLRDVLAYAPDPSAPASNDDLTPTIMPKMPNLEGLAELILQVTAVGVIFAGCVVVWKAKKAKVGEAANIGAVLAIGAVIITGGGALFALASGIVDLSIG